MRAAIYARYSSENQRPESIDDQIQACQALAAARGYLVDPRHIYRDEAKSGVLRDRPGLEVLLTAARARQFEAVLVDDLSRLSRDNHFLLTLYAEFRFNGVRIISRADSLDSDDDHAKLGFQMRGIVNELYLDDLREKTLRGQKGQKARGFTVGEATYGYRSVPVGEMRVDRRGRPRPDGYRMIIEPPEAEVVLRIFRDFGHGKAIKALVKELNAEEIPGRRKLRLGWSASTVSRILKNEKYIGRWIWNRSETRRDPKTGRRRKFPKPESEWHVSHDAELRIVPQEIWDRAITRWQEIDHTWPQRRTGKTAGTAQRSYIEAHPRHLLSGALQCGLCGGTMGQVSGKGSGYYGCLGAARGACTNKLLVARRITERAVLTAVQERLRDPGSIRYLLERVEAEVQRLHAHLPEEIRVKRAALSAEERRIANYIEFIGGGKGTRALGEALSAAEQKAAILRSDLKAYEASAGAVFKAPPVEWIADQLRALQPLLEAEPSRSGLLLRRVLGPVRLEPIAPQVGKAYYQAETTLQTLDLIEAPEGGSTWSHWWRRWASNPLRPFPDNSAGSCPSRLIRHSGRLPPLALPVNLAQFRWFG
jgi:DNA invertase Pin-like site-specific DNA recombinase